LACLGMGGAGVGVGLIFANYLSGALRNPSAADSQFARLIFGSNHARLIPASAVLGAFLVLLADDAARTILAPVELPVGIVTALLGAPFFLYLLKTRRQEL